MFGYQPKTEIGAEILNPIETPHTFAGNPIDRGDTLRRDESEIAGLMRSDSTQVLILAGLDPLITSSDDTTANLGWLNYKSANELVGSEPILASFLGIDAEGNPLVAWNVKGSARHGSEQIPESATAKLNLKLCDARESATVISGEETGILSQARANLGWHSTHLFCARCGDPTEMRRGGLMRQCTGCNGEHFPRTDPVIITVVTDGDRCILGQSAGRLSAMKMYSALAGFMDHGESMEEAVRREVWEEAGIRVGRVQYHSTQPWPFPSSLMIGSHCEALTTNVDMDDFEMTDVRWWSREEVLLALAEKSEVLRVPGPIAIAHHLIKAWATGKAGNFRTS
ncbi:MAG: NAD(+) diphosphatase [Chloroflexi bacterium]|nr:NAD(+) diphosphatase [Chloroflexota bacterium]